MPDNSALSVFAVLSSGFDAEILVGSAGLFDSCIKHNEIMNQLKETMLPTHLSNRSIKWILDVPLFFPLKEKSFRCTDDSMTKTFSIVAREDELNGRKEVLN